MKPLCIDLFCGLGGWTEGFLAEGYAVIGFDNHRHEYGWRKCEECDGTGNFYRHDEDGDFLPCDCMETYGGERGGTVPNRYPGQLVIQDVLTIHGSQFRDAAVIVASPPCQNYSYLAMPWSRSTNPDNSKAAKALRLKWETEGPDNRLFDACFRIQREAIAASKCPACFGRGIVPLCKTDTCRYCHGSGKRYIPLIVENVRGAIPWVGRSAWNYGSFHLWGDVPALMPINLKRAMKQNPDGTAHPAGSWFRIADSSQGDRGVKVGTGEDYNRSRRPHLTNPAEQGTKIGGDWFSDSNSTCRKHGSKSSARKAASAQIAKIPFPLSSHIAQVYYPKEASL